MAIDVKSAVIKAAEYFKSLFVDVSNIQLEEVELSEDGRWWFVTFSFSRPSTALGIVFPQKEFKTVELNAEDGQPRAIRIRKND